MFAAVVVAPVVPLVAAPARPPGEPPPPLVVVEFVDEEVEVAGAAGLLAPGAGGVQAATIAATAHAAAAFEIRAIARPC